MTDDASGRHVHLSLPEDDKHGTYANFLAVSHTPHEFTLDFCQLQPQSDDGDVKADVVARIRIPPTLVGRVMQALNTNMASYEERYGDIRAV